MSEAPKRIGVFRVGHIGDTVIAMPAFWTVRKTFPDARILYLNQVHKAGTFSQGLEVLRKGTVYDEVLSYTLKPSGVSPWQMLQTLLALRSKRLDMLVYLPPVRTPKQLDRDEKFFRLAGVKRIVGMRGYRETDYCPKGSPLPTVTHESDILLRHLERDGIVAPEDPKNLAHLGLSDEERKAASDWLANAFGDSDRPLIGFGPGSKMPAKLWPMDRFIAVAQALDAEFNANFLVLGGPAEAESCEKLARSVTHGVSSAGGLSVRLAAAVLERSVAYVGNDTGTMHLAASAGVPCVGIFSARDYPGRWYPYGDHHRVHRIPVPCEGCMLEVCDKDSICLTQIGVETVIASAKSVVALSTRRLKPV